MKKLVVVAAVVMLSSAAWGQTKLTPTDQRVDANCKPIGRTATGELVYSMKCDHLPAPPPRATAATPGAPVAAAPAADSQPVEVEEEDKGGLFGRAPSFIRPTNSDSQRSSGVGPASQTR